MYASPSEYPLRSTEIIQGKKRCCIQYTVPRHRLRAWEDPKKNTKYEIYLLHQLSLQMHIHSANPLDLSMASIDVMVACKCFGSGSPWGDPCRKALTRDFFLCIHSPTHTLPLSSPPPKSTQATHPLPIHLLLFCISFLHFRISKSSYEHHLLHKLIDSQGSGVGVSDRHILRSEQQRSLATRQRPSTTLSVCWLFCQRDFVEGSLSPGLDLREAASGCSSPSTFFLPQRFLGYC